MDIQLNKQSETEATIKVSLSEADYQQNIDKKLKDYRKKVSLKGFRPGKVPTTLIKKMYGKAILFDEVNHTLSHALQDYIKNNELKIIGDPLINEDKAKEIDWDHQTDFNFEYEVGLTPNFEVKQDLKLTQYVIKVDDKELDKAVEKLLEQYGSVENLEVSERGDTVFGTLTLDGTDFTKDSLVDPEKLLKKNEKLFVGVKKDDVVTFDIAKLFSKKEDLAVFTGKTNDEVEDLEGEYSFTVKNINRTVKAELNQEFFDKIFGEGKVKSEEEFRTKYTEILEGNYKKDSQYLLANEIQKDLIEGVKIDLPESFYKKWILKTNENLKAEDLDKDFEFYLKDLKWTLIKGNILEGADVKIEEQDIISRTVDMFKEQFGGSMGDLSPELEQQMEGFAKNYLSQNEGQNYMNVVNTVRTDKVIDLVKEKSTIKEKEVTLAEFEKQAKKQ